MSLLSTLVGSLDELAGLTAPLGRASVHHGIFHSEWVWSASSGQVACARGGWWQLVPAGGVIYAGTLATLAADVAVCAATGAKLVIASGTAPAISATIDTPPINIECQPGGWIAGTNVFGPAIRFNVGAETEGVEVKLRYVLTTTTSGDLTDTCGLYVQDAPGANPATMPFWYNRFDVETYGCTQHAVMDRATFTDAYGRESYNSYNAWRIRGHGDGAYFTSGFARYGVKFKQGSGTGNIFEEFRGALAGDKPAWVRVEAKQPGSCCGDLLVVGCHLGGTNAAVFSFGAGLVYGNMVAVVGSQIDAGMTTLAYFDDPSETWLGIKLVGCNVGGGTDLFAGCPPIAQSIINDREVSRWSSGRVIDEVISGSVTRSVFAITLAPYSSTKIELVQNGLISNVGSGCVAQNFAVTSYANSVSVTSPGIALSNPASPPAGFWQLGYLCSGLTVTFTVTYATSGAVHSDSQLIATGGTFVARRLPQ